MPIKIVSLTVKFLDLQYLFLGKFFMDVNIPLLLAFVVYFLALAWRMHYICNFNGLGPCNFPMEMVTKTKDKPARVLYEGICSKDKPGQDYQEMMELWLLIRPSAPLDVRLHHHGGEAVVGCTTRPMRWTRSSLCRGSVVRSSTTSHFLMHWIDYWNVDLIIRRLLKTCPSHEHVVICAAMCS